MTLIRVVCCGILALVSAVFAVEPCNNSPTLCGRRYNAITHMGAHNSPFLRDDSTKNSLAGNQYLNATVGLSAGLRLLQAQVHDRSGTLHLCHTSCDILDAGPLDAWLRLIGDWMAAHTRDVVTLLLVNSDKASASRLGAAFAAAGLDQLAYTPPAPLSATPTATADWPTLQDMVANGTRLVAFATNFEYAPQTPYLLPEFDFVFETPYQVTAASGFNCTLDRPATDKLRGSPTTALRLHYLSLVNHFQYRPLFGNNILVPDVDAIHVTNDPGTDADGMFGRHVEQCASEWGSGSGGSGSGGSSVRPNFALVDFWNVETPIAAVDRLNGVSDITGRTPVSSVASKVVSGASIVGGGSSSSRSDARSLILALAAATWVTLWA